MPLQSGPVNITQGNSANFVVEFLDTNGDLTVPVSASMTIVYTSQVGSASSDAVTLTLDNSFFTGTWSSTSAALGLATWYAFTTSSATTQASGQLRIIDTDG